MGSSASGYSFWEMFHWAGEGHQRAVWHQFFPARFLEIARVRTRETSDPLCMVIYTCFDQSHEFITDICGDQGLPILAEIVRTASTDQAFLMDIVSEIFNEQINEMTASSDVALCVLGILRKSTGVLDSVSRCKSRFSGGSYALNVLKYSFTILREICARDGQKSSHERGSVDVVDLLVSLGLSELLLCLLRDLEPPAIIRKAFKQGRNQDGAASYYPSPILTEGFGGILLPSLAIVHTEGSMYKMKSGRGMGFFYYYNSV